jgi:hypothetical protein
MTATEVEVEAAEVTEVVEEQTAVDTDATTRTAVYKYHCCTVPQNVQRAWDAHFRMANIYYNRMVDVFQASLDRYRELRRKHSPEIEKLDKEYAELQELKSTQTQQMSELRAEQYKLKKRKTDVTTELVKVTQDISQLREAMKERAARQKTNKESRDAANAALKSDVVFQKAQEEAHQQHNAEVKKLYAEYKDLFWPTKNALKADVERAFMARRGGNVQKRRATHRGKLTLQLQNEVTTDQLMNPLNLWCRIVPQARPSGTEPRNPKRQLRKVSMRIGSNPDRTPVMAEAVIRYSRPLPEHDPENGKTAVCVQVVLTREMIGHRRYKSERVAQGEYRPHYYYTVQFTVKHTYQNPLESQGEGKVGVDLGWRLMPDGSLRVAYWADDAGRQGELSIGAEHLSRWSHSHGIQSILDNRLNEAVHELKQWYVQQLGEDPTDEARATLPDWFHEHMDQIGKSRAPGLLHRLLDHWVRNRFPNDQIMFERMWGPGADKVTAARSALVQWFRDNNATGLSVPDQVRELMIEAIQESAGHSSLQRLVDVWTRQRFAGDEEIFRQVQIVDRSRYWRDQHYHLVSYYRHNSIRAINIRKEMYIQFARELGKKYQQIFVEAMDIRKLQQNRPVTREEDDKIMAQYGAGRHVLAAVGELRKLLLQVCGSKVVLKPAQNTTSNCFKCGSTQEWDRRQLTHSCTSCSTVWDQDYNAARNLLA